MAISINWGARVITVPQADLTFVSAGLYELDVDAFRLALKGLEDGDDGMTFPATHRHNTAVTLSGVTYARIVEIINGYTVEFEDGQYTVRCVGANHNLADVKVVNQVSLIVGNSAGLVVAGGGSGSSAAELWNYAVEGAMSAADLMRIMAAVLAGKTTITNLGGGAGNVVFRAADDSADRVDADMTGSERTNVTLTP